MSTSTRVTRSKGKSDGLSLPEMSRPQRKPTNMENDDGDTILNTTFNAGSSQHHPQMPIHTSSLRSQSTLPQTGTMRMQEIPVPVAPQEPITPHIPANCLFSFSLFWLFAGLLVPSCPKHALVLGNGCERFCASRSLLGSYVHQKSI